MAYPGMPRGAPEGPPRGSPGAPGRNRRALSVSFKGVPNADGSSPGSSDQDPLGVYGVGGAWAYPGIPGGCQGGAHQRSQSMLGNLGSGDSLTFPTGGSPGSPRGMPAGPLTAQQQQMMMHMLASAPPGGASAALGFAAEQYGLAGAPGGGLGVRDLGAFAAVRPSEPGVWKLRRPNGCAQCCGYVTGGGSGEGAGGGAGEDWGQGRGEEGLGEGAGGSAGGAAGGSGGGWNVGLGRNHSFDSRGTSRGDPSGL